MSTKSLSRPIAPVKPGTAMCPKCERVLSPMPPYPHPQFWCLDCDMEIAAEDVRWAEAEVGL